MKPPNVNDLLGLHLAKKKVVIVVWITVGSSKSLPECLKMIIIHFYKRGESYKEISRYFKLQIVLDLCL